ncbi:MAG TPA: hypothetical protein VIJ16_09945 [Gemmatimonadaceae bacterium]
MSAPTPVVVSWSGGKDSTLMLERLLADPAVRVVSLLTTVTAGYDRISMHGVRRAILERQAQALNMPLEVAEIPMQASNESYEAAFGGALARLRVRRPALDTVAFGDLFLTEVRDYRDALLARLGWKGLYPIWGRDTTELAHEFIDRGHRAILTCVDTTQLDATFAGREYNESLIADLPATADPCGEKGEFHSCLVDGPLLREPIAVRLGERVLREGRFQYCDLTLE